ncbi:succinylglutamate desuccinylase/aspartoacylase domain-containing protein [Pseudohongiella sp.]|uniref:Succinylglutamate desuccinylase/Aspartoacylase catalytic domain-containing protein n=1 Tax=marine sediment metagenome TaxID=412755 RepID=A0A0F9W5N3_9ZZZZ|nr:succinylglutamate desuccinylase/aspartoacylase family protein [Pseudohongiella sp.]
MSATQLHVWRDPLPADIAPLLPDFLEALPGPTHIQLSGRDASRCRVVVTLLHGNEPSGLTAVHALLRQGLEPAVDIHIFIVNVDAAREQPMFSYRMLPGDRDLNRSFKAPFDSDPQSRLAKVLLDCWQTLAPEALIDIHNTSGLGPSFGVVTSIEPEHEALISLFTHRMVMTDLVLGSVMDLSGRFCPVVTIECGGARSDESDRTALIGLTQYVSLAQVLDLAPNNDVIMDYFHHPLRLELLPGASVDFGNEALLVRGVTLLPDLEQLNFNHVEPDTRLGYITGELTDVLQARTSAGENRLQHFFHVDDGCLLARVRMKFFMVTNNPEIARTDCLLYFVPA